MSVANGPMRLLLQSSSGQYILLGAGAYALFPEKVQQLLTSVFSRYPLLGSSNFSDGRSQVATPPPAPIIIQTPSSSRDSSSLIPGTGTFVYAVVGAGVCWAGYIVCIELLPDAVTELLPVTKRAFQQATKALGEGISNVKEALEEQLLGLTKKQNELGHKQDETNKKVGGIQKDLHSARFDLNQLREALEQCQISLDNTQNMQGYTLRGVKLLVRCVTSILPDDSRNEDGVMKEIDRFMRDGDEGDEADSFESLPKSNEVPPMAEVVTTPIAHAQAVSSMGLLPNKLFQSTFSPSPMTNARRQSQSTV